VAMIDLNSNPSRRDLRLFALVWFPALFALIGGIVFQRTGSLPVAGAIWGGALAVSAVGLLVPAFMRLVYLGMLYAVFPIGWTVSLLLLAAIYYLVLTPIGLAQRAVGRDALRLRKDHSARSPRSPRSPQSPQSPQSYWVPYEPPENAERYFGQS
jgi:hypothetical protein